MFKSLALAAALCATALAATAPARAASPIVTEMSSPMGWGFKGTQAYLVIQYNANAPTPLTVNSVQVYDTKTGIWVATKLISCGTNTAVGGAPAHVLQPGQACNLYVTRAAGNGQIVGRIMVSDSTTGTTNIANFVRASVETRDANYNLLTRADLR
jgi:hypothetical protein